MARRHFNLATLGSAVVAILILVAWPLASHVDPRSQRVKLTSQCYVSISAWGGDADARVVIFNVSFGPYAGGIISIAGAGPDRVRTDTPQPSGFGDT